MATKLATIGHCVVLPGYWVGGATVNTRRALRHVTCTAVSLMCGFTFFSTAIAEEATSAPNPADTSTSTDGLSDLSIEQLLNVEVTSVSKKKERLQDAAAAIYVLTQEDIRRSGATNIPSLLRTVPGIEVARLTANSWSVTSRGFGGIFANKLLVLIDGRSVYTPLFSGVYWEHQNLLLEDVERIEIIRGPGGTLWGANAVNGVINIITKNAGDTQGLLVSAGGGTEEQGFLNTRWGGSFADGEGHYRVYSQLFRHDNGGKGANGEEAYDDWQGAHGGTRVDWKLSSEDTLSLQANFQALDINQEDTIAFLDAPFSRNVKLDDDASTWDVSGVWTHVFSDDSTIEVSGYYDGYHRDNDTFSEDRHNFNLEFQHQIRPWDKHEIVWGLAFRSTLALTDGSEFTQVNPERRDDQTYSAFAQDDIALTDELHLIVGTKIEHNDYTGVEVQPNVRMRWSPNDRHTLWAAVSRAVRTPSQAEDDIRLRSVTAPGPTEAVLAGDRNFDSEDLLAAELGYRVRVNEKLSVDLAVFFNHYSNLRSIERGTSFTDNGVNVIPFEARNNSDADAFGFEIAADWGPTAWWQIRAGYSFLNLHVDTVSTDPITETTESDTPNHQFFLQDRFNLPKNIEFDTTLRFVDNLSSLDVDAYIEMDARLAWRPTEDLEIAIVGQNLLNKEHFEFAPSFVNQVPTQVERGVYGKVTWKFQPGKH